MSGFAGNTQLTLEVKNANDDSIKSITEKIMDIKIIDVHKKDLHHIIKLEYPKDKEPREQIFNYAVESNWIITEMSPQSTNLESIFRTLTMEESANA